MAHDHARHLAARTKYAQVYREDQAAFAERVLAEHPDAKMDPQGFSYTLGNQWRGTGYLPSAERFTKEDREALLNWSCAECRALPPLFVDGVLTDKTGV